MRIASPPGGECASPRFVAAVDAAFRADGKRIVAGVVLWDAWRGAAIEQHTVRRAVRFPYVPGLLSFREAPAVLAALRRLRQTPDVVFCDGQGLAHPRRFGLACHVGLWVDLPTVGVAKSRLCGEHDQPGARRGDACPLRLDGEVVGAVLRTRANVRPLFVSPGNLCEIEWATRVVLATTTSYRLPEPARLAHQLVTRARRSPAAT
ncbi:MAG: endonuclease V [Phycisphaerae bacterium]